MDFNYDANLIIINLETLGKLNKGNKLNTRNMYFSIDPANWYQGIVRYHRWEDRNLTYEKIKNLMEDVQLIIDPTKSYFTIFEYKNIHDFYLYINPMLNSAYIGIGTLMLTYEEDKTFISKIKVLLDKVKRLIDKTSIEYKGDSV